MIIILLNPTIKIRKIRKKCPYFNSWPGDGGVIGLLSYHYFYPECLRFNIRLPTVHLTLANQVY